MFESIKRPLLPSTNWHFRPRVVLRPMAMSGSFAAGGVVPGNGQKVSSPPFADVAAERFAAKRAWDTHIMSRTALGTGLRCSRPGEFFF